MKATGIIRRIDDLGRIAIPKEIRRICRIQAGDPFEIFTDKENEETIICLKKYDTNFLSPLNSLATAIDDEMYDANYKEERLKVRELFNEIKKIVKEFEERE